MRECANMNRFLRQEGFHGLFPALQDLRSHCPRPVRPSPPRRTPGAGRRPCGVEQIAILCYSYTLLRSLMIDAIVGRWPSIWLGTFEASLSVSPCTSVDSVKYRREGWMLGRSRWRPTVVHPEKEASGSCLRRCRPERCQKTICHGGSQVLEVWVFRHKVQEARWLFLQQLRDGTGGTGRSARQASKKWPVQFMGGASQTAKRLNRRNLHFATLALLLHVSAPANCRSQL